MKLWQRLFLVLGVLLTSYYVLYDKLGLPHMHVNFEKFVKLFLVPILFLFIIHVKQVKLWYKVALGLLFGILYGFIAGPDAAYIKPIGDLFINSILMIIVPLVLFTVISGITSMSDPTTLGRVGIKACIAYLSTTTFAIFIGISLAMLLKPGEGVFLDLSGIPRPEIDKITVQSFSIIKMIVNIVPTNIVAAMAQTNVLQVVFFAMFTGITLLKMGSPNGTKLIEIIRLFTKLVLKMISIIIQFSPYGAFAFTSWVIGTQGVDILSSLAKLVGTMMLGMFVQYLLFGVFIAVFAKLSPMPFYRKSLEYQALAFSTSSSKATLATTMKVCQDRLGISNSNTSFVLPLGAAINMDGLAIYLGMCTMFFVQATGTILQPHDYIVIIITATLGSIGGAGVPGSALVMLPMILATVNIPIEGIALIAGINAFGDMFRTAINITGDATVTLIIDKSEGQLDEKMYYSDN